jgi:hypothetical protein
LLLASCPSSSPAAFWSQEAQQGLSTLFNLLQRSMTAMFLFLCALALFGASANAFTLQRPASRMLRPVSKSRLSMSMGGLPAPMATLSHMFVSTLQLADTSITEEEVLSVTGATAELPDPIFVIVAAGVLLVGIAVLQFSLGDLTKEVRLRMLHVYPLLFFPHNLPTTNHRCRRGKRG